MIWHNPRNSEKICVKYSTKYSLSGNIEGAYSADYPDAESAAQPERAKKWIRGEGGIR